MSERKETDLDKSAKFVTMFTQLEQMLGMEIKDEFILNKLFPNDIMSDIIDMADDITEEEIIENDDEQSEEDIMSLFESGQKSLSKRSINNTFFDKVQTNGNVRTYSWKLKMNINW